MVSKISKNDGIALVTALMLTLISMTIIMALLYMVTQSVKTSGQTRKYRTAVEAAYGGTDIVVKDIVPIIMQNYSSSTFKTTLESAFPLVGLQMLSDPKCMQRKLTKATASWPAGCSSSPDPKKSPDMQITLQSTSGNPFIVSSKIVGTVAGNSDTSGLQLEGSGVAESSTLLTPQHIPYVYRIEIQGERQGSAGAQANIEVLYSY